VRFPIQRSKCANTAATPLFVDYVGTLGDEDLCVVSPDTDGAKRAELSRETLEAGLRTAADQGVRGQASQRRRRLGRPVRRGCGEAHRPRRRRPDQHTGGTLLRAARAARKGGARRVLALVTHGFFMPGAVDVVADPAIDRLICH
jgi:ribose-phosphate pyrophosphokinase